MDSVDSAVMAYFISADKLEKLCSLLPMLHLEVRRAGPPFTFEVIIEAFRLCLKRSYIGGRLRVEAGIELKRGFSRHYSAHFGAGKAEDIFDRGVFQATPIHRQYRHLL
ncbi:hypothetical protein [Oceanisphaera sp. KMM 10153]|uniref:hypothetical protein n=1 Tax=Oceanisphaera submarina TaxID=3390193 RepID=UPI00397603D9